MLIIHLEGILLFSDEGADLRFFILARIEARSKALEVRIAASRFVRRISEISSGSYLARTLEIDRPAAFMRISVDSYPHISFVDCYGRDGKISPIHPPKPSSTPQHPLHPQQAN